MEPLGDPGVAAMTDANASSTAMIAGTRFRMILDQRSRWLEALIVLSVTAVFFVVLGYLAAYFQDYFHLILMFALAGLLAFIISPFAGFLEKHLPHMPRALSVIAVIVPVIVIIALLMVRIAVSLAESFASLAAALPGLIENPPSFLIDLQTWFDQQGIDVNVISTFESIIKGVLQGMTDLMIAVFGGVVGAVGTFVDAIIVVSLAVFMAIDRDKILRLGLDVVPPERRPEALLFRSRVATAFVGFIRSQVILGALYGVWAFGVNLLFGLPFAGATAFLAAVIMAIPIYGPYVSWLPPVLVALLVNPAIALPVAAIMLVGWFIDENILAPLVRAGALELHPIVVTFAFLLGAQLAGAIGAIIAIPLAAVVQAFLVEYFDQYRKARGWERASGDAAAPPSAASPPVAPEAIAGGG